MKSPKNDNKILLYLCTALFFPPQRAVMRYNNSKKCSAKAALGSAVAALTKRDNFCGRG
jgi:hypothetical protein